MTENRKKHLIFLGILLILLVIHFIWGKTILLFLSSTILYWIIGAVFVICMVDEIITIIKNYDYSEAEGFIMRKVDEHKTKVQNPEKYVSPYEAEGNPIPPAYERNNTPPEDNSHA